MMMNLWVIPYHHKSREKFKSLFLIGERWINFNILNACCGNHIGPERDR